MGKAALQWTEDMLAQLGTDKDAVLAERWGTSAKTVNLKRNALGIPAFALVQWTLEMQAALGTDSDAELAKRWGMSKASVVAKRKELGIASLTEKQGAGFVWTDAAVALLGTASDAKVAAQLGVTRLTVYNARLARDIPAAARSGTKVDVDALSGSVADGLLSKN